jgi:type IV secretion system protein VirB1
MLELVALAFLSLAQLTVLAGTCAPGVAPATIAALARVESGFETNAINDNTTKREYKAADKAEAVAIAQQLQNAGHSIDLGLMQINNQNFGWTGLTLEDAFDPCASMQAAQTILTGFSKYNTGSPKRGFANGYVAKVVAASAEIKTGVEPPPTITAQATVAAPKQADWNVFPDDDVPSTPLSSAPNPTEGNHDQPAQPQD